MIATDPLSLVFIGCFLFGLLYLLVTALLGSIGHSHIHSDALHHVDPGAIAHSSQGGALHHAQDIVHHSHYHSSQQNGSHLSIFSVINPTSIILFLLGFGFFGYVFHTTTLFALPLIVTFSGVGGLIIAALLLLLVSRYFGDSEAATIQDVSDRTGLLGKVSITIQQDGIGEILYVSPGGMRKSIPARSIDGRRLERDQEVVVVNYQHGVAEVDTWDHFVNQEDAEPGILPEEDDLATLRALLEEPDNNKSEYMMRNDFQKE
jgi:hypothetical protein